MENDNLIPDTRFLSLNKCPTLFQFEQLRDNQDISDYYLCDQTYMSHYLTTHYPNMDVMENKYLSIKDLKKYKMDSTLNGCFIFPNIEIGGVAISPHGLMLINGEWQLIGGVQGYHITAPLILMMAVWDCFFEKEGITISTYTAIKLKTAKKYKISPKSWLSSQDIESKVKNKHALVEQLYEKVKQLDRYQEETSLSIKCFKPQRCAYLSTCWKTDKPTHIFNLMDYPAAEKIVAFKNQVTTFDQLISSNLVLSKKQTNQIHAEMNQVVYMQTEVVNNLKKSLGEHFQTFDIEVFQRMFSDKKRLSPMEKIPFLFSVHHYQDGKLEHRYFCQEPNQTCYRKFAEQCITSIDRELPIVVFDKTLEAEILDYCINNFSDLASDLRHIKHQLIDISIPFKQGAIYIPKMNGRLTLKAIYHAIDTATPFDQLSIQSGLDLVQALSLYDTFSDQEKRKCLDTCIEYCRYDTLAIYQIVRFLAA